MKFKKIFASLAVLCVIVGTCTLASCQKIVADLVVFGKIFTAENNQLVEAFAVKNGKYIFVGDKKMQKNLFNAEKLKLLTTAAKV